MINPFPPLGERRFWTPEYFSQELKKLNIDEFEFRTLGKLVSASVNSVPDCSGVYLFVYRNEISNFFDDKSEIQEVIYVGKAKNLNQRFKDYIASFDELAKVSPKAKIRDAERILFRHFKGGFSVWYLILPPDVITKVEDSFIILLDPILNTDQKLDEDSFAKTGDVLGGNFNPGQPAFS